MSIKTYGDFVKFTHKTKKQTEKSNFSPFFVYFSQFLKIPLERAGIMLSSIIRLISSSVMPSKIALRPTKFDMPISIYATVVGSGATSASGCFESADV